MQYALVSDIHGNLEALEAVLRFIDERYPASRLLCPGDIVGYGPDPAACIDRLVQRGVPCVRGNHEEMVLGRRDFSRCVAAGITAARWTRRQLAPSQRHFLDQLPGHLSIADNLLMCHGDLSSADNYLSDAAAAEAALVQLNGLAPDARILVCGHTHHAALYSAEDGFRPQAGASTLALHPGRRYVLNPGAVGQSRDGQPLARFALVDLERQFVEFQQLPYDHAKTEDKMRRAGLMGGVVLTAPRGLWRGIERSRTRWARFWGERENRRLGFEPQLHG
jgi:diadenosine tetraphosphatase ApaH/serine/threonine PP2A family protein phosphatase